MSPYKKAELGRSSYPNWLPRSSMVRKLTVVLLAILVMAFFPAAADTISCDHPLIESVELLAENHRIKFVVHPAYPISSYFPRPGTASRNGFPYSYKINITEYRDVNGTWFPADKTFSGGSRNYEYYNGTVTYVTYSFDSLRPTSSAVAVRGYLTIRVPGEGVGRYFLSDGGVIWITQESNRYIFNVDDAEGTLIEVFELPLSADTITISFGYDLETDSLTTYGTSVSLPTSWSPVEGCGPSHISRLGGFSITYYAENPSTASAVISRVADQIKADSHNLSWIESFEIKDAVNFTALAESKNKTVEELTPADFGFYQAPRGRITIIDVPSSINMGASGVAGPGIIFVYAPDESVLLHEIAHEAGFCDPDPYEDWKAYWDSYLGEGVETSVGNATWQASFPDGTNFYVQLTSTPICIASKTVSLQFSVTSNPSGKTANYTISATGGQISNNRGYLTTPATVNAVYQAPLSIENPVALDYITFSLTYNGRTINFPFTLSVMNQSYYPNVTENSTIVQQLQDLSNSLANLTSNINSTVVTDPRAVEYYTKANDNYLKAKEDAQRAQETNDSRIASMWIQAANYRIQAANLYLQAAQAIQSTLNLISYLPIASDQLQGIIDQAQYWEQKAQQMEMAAATGGFGGIGGIGDIFAPNPDIYNSLVEKGMPEELARILAMPITWVVVFFLIIVLLLTRRQGYFVSTFTKVQMRIRSHRQVTLNNG
ncbi:MAG: hypothetical protein DRN78_02815 [Thermoproteota archaeon]|nr:MAG: hypothetical protein DRN78_02815 [Candidatus Korarchaeota archaeon]